MNPAVVKRHNVMAVAMRQVKLGKEPIAIGLLQIRTEQCIQRRHNQGQQVPSYIKLQKGMLLVGTRSLLSHRGMYTWEKPTELNTQLWQNQFSQDSPFVLE